MRLHISFAVGAVFAASAFGACASDPDTSGTGVDVVATTTQIGALVREIAGDDVRLTILLPAGADAHDYEPDPQALVRVHDADLVLRHGMHLDEWLDDAIEGAGGDAEVVEVTAGIQPRTDIDGAEDPHVWHNPEYAKIMVDNIAAALQEADPGKAPLFSKRAGEYIEQLDATDQAIRALIDEIPSGNRKMVTNHDAFGYFIEHYGLEFVAAVIPSANRDSQVSADELADLQDVIAREGVKVIFAEEEVDPGVARELARDAGVAIVEGLYADSLGEPGSGADTIDGMLLLNARKIAEALK